MSDVGKLSIDARAEALRHWLIDEVKIPVMRLESASSDASFRRYFRAWRRDGSSYVVMDAPPDKEDVRPFLRVAALLEATGVHVPHVEAADPGRGFVLLEDLGSVHYLQELRRGADPDVLYGEAMLALLQIQVRGAEGARELPPYDAAALDREMALMPEWFCGRHLGRDGTADAAALVDTFASLRSQLLAQPRVFVHRDYHSRNLMWLPDRSPGIIDFQDALAGPIAYDLVSLLKDCYIDWPRARVEGWVERYHALLRAEGALAGVGTDEFLRWFDFAGLQRHIKVLGIFARLWYRDGKAGYLADLPLTFEYVRDAARRYPEFDVFSLWLDSLHAPFSAAQGRALVEAGMAR